jgi:L,D-transpeptidase ErfK/SrfK
MGRHLLSSLRHHPATVVAIAILAGAGPLGCGITGPAPDHHGDAAGARTGDEKKQADPGPTRLVLRLGERRLYVMDDDPGTPTESFPIAIGKDGWDTPPGRFHVEEMVEHPDFLKIDTTVVPAQVIKRIPPGPTNPLGERWIGFAHGDGWTLGIHGTPNPELLGHAVSHGCIRMRNSDVIRVYDRVQLGTTVIVEP